MLQARMLSIAAVLASIVVAGAASAPVTQTPVRDVAKPQVGTGSISGRVVTNDANAQPIRRVMLLLTGGDLAIGRQTTTDDEGRFLLSALPPGRYTLTAWRNGFVRDVYGNKRPGIGTGAPIILSAGQRADLTFRLTRGAVITGRVLSAGMKPNRAIQIQAMQYRTVAGERVLRPSTTGGTSPIAGAGGWVDDRGVYRIYGLAPGEYVIAARPGAGGGAIREVTSDEVQWAMQQAQAQGANNALLPAPEAASRTALAPVYYPGTTDPASATTITLGAGEERTGVDIALQLVPVATVQGLIVEPDGQAPASADVTMTRSGPLVESETEYERSERGGRFTVSGLAPGHYTLVVQAVARASVAGSSRPVPSLWGMTEIDVDGRDISGLVVTLQPGVPVSGRVVFQGQAAAGDMRGVRLRLASTQPGARAANFLAQAAADGTFTFPGVAPGAYRLVASPPATAWTPKSAVVGGRDWIDEPMEIRLGQRVSGVVVTFTDRPAEVFGTVSDRTGQPTLDFFIVVFPADRRFWTPFSRHVAYARPDSNGTFRMTGLPPSQYYLCAVTDLDSESVTETSFLETLVPASTKFTLAEGEKKVQDVRLATGG